MSLIKLDIYNVRNISRATLNPSSTINFIFGDNASGKSSLLEAIYILGRLKSFRSNNLKKVIHFDEQQLILSGQVSQATELPITMGVRLDHKQIETRFNQQTIKSRSEFAYALPLQLIHPKSYKLLDAGPQLRREFIDWGIFNTHKEYLLHWRNFKKTLSQRNSLLKRRLINQLQVWDKELLKYCTIMTDYRRSYLEQLKPIFLDVANQFLKLDQLDLTFYAGWDQTKNYELALQASVEKDLKYGYTTCGPHHSDFKLLVNEKLAKEYVSRGQLKLLVLALKLAQVKYLQNQRSVFSCILIDDLASELDKTNKKKLLSFLANTGMQVFITATDREDFGDISQFSKSTMFHVEHGRINQI
jgi:DNA replication and repair protein RecF